MDKIEQIAVLGKANAAVNIRQWETDKKLRAFENPRIIIGSTS
jgi:hypothetical protein